MSKLKVLFINGGANGCDFYRILQPGRALLELDQFEIAISKFMTQLDLETFIDFADVFYFQKTSSSFLKFMYENKGKRQFIMDQDDDNFSVSPFNPGYIHYGTKEVNYSLDTGPVSLKDKTNGFDIDRNRHNLKILKTSLELATRITTPSPVLSGKLKRINPKTQVVPNLIDFKNWEPLNFVKDKWIRIGYQCGWSHFEDFWEVQSALKEILNKYPNVRLVIMGQPYWGAMKDYPQDRVDVIPWVDIEAYPWRLKSLNLDVGIAPLMNSEFNNAKSVVKWEEYSALKISCVASDVVPYSLRIVPGDTGFLCNSPQEWVQTLSNLVESRELRQSISERAYAHVKENYSLDTGILQYENLIKEVCGVKPEILTVQ